MWEHRVGKGSALGGIEWGSAADEQNGYFATADAQAGAEAGGLAALRLGTGEQVWHARPPAVECKAGDRNCATQAQSAAISAMPGVVFSGTTNGILRAYSTADGKVLWEYNRPATTRRSTASPPRADPERPRPGHRRRHAVHELRLRVPGLRRAGQRAARVRRGVSLGSPRKHEITKNDYFVFSRFRGHHRGEEYRRRIKQWSCGTGSCGSGQ